jgi:hypothetical protein
MEGVCVTCRKSLVPSAYMKHLTSSTISYFDAICLNIFFSNEFQCYKTLLEDEKKKSLEESLRKRHEEENLESDVSGYNIL